MNQAIKFGLLCGAMLAAAAGRAQAQLDFDFSFSNTTGNTSGTVTGEILGLSDNSTGSASSVIIDSYPTDAMTIEGNDAVAWQTQNDNSFTVENGQITAVDFNANNPFMIGSPPQFATEELELTGGPGPIGPGEVLLFNVGSYEANIQNEGGIAPDGVTFTAVPEPATLPILATALLAFGACGVCRRRAKQRGHQSFIDS